MKKVKRVWYIAGWYYKDGHFQITNILNEPDSMWLDDDLENAVPACFLETGRAFMDVQVTEYDDGTIEAS